VVYYLRSEESNERNKVAEIAAGFQEAVVDVLVTKAFRAAKKYGVKEHPAGRRSRQKLQTARRAGFEVRRK
jgi:tRNA A37 threonylcarbamoyltransferase TsaD